jgi:hypothetical protein
MGDKTAIRPPSCPKCGGDTVQKSRTRLLIVGAAMIATLTLPLVIQIAWVPAIAFGMVGSYLVAWATIGRGAWCRNCKSFPIKPSTDRSGEP